MVSAQTLSEEDRRLLAGWAVSCAERVLDLLDAGGEADRQLRDALGRARVFASGGSTAAAEIAVRMVPVKAAKSVRTPSGAAVARSIAQAAAVAHMGAHALGAAGYAVKALQLAGADDARLADEVAWQLAALTPEQRAALRRLPMLGSDRGGPLGPGLLCQGVVGDTIRQLQAGLSA